MTTHLALRIRFRFSWQLGILAQLLVLCFVQIATLLAASPPSLPGTVAFRNNKNWTKFDNRGFRWNITREGTVAGIADSRWLFRNGNGWERSGVPATPNTNTYARGLRLMVNGSPFSAPNYRNRLIGERGISLGPWTKGSLSVTRQIYIDQKASYGRWIDTVTNTGTATKTVTLLYHSQLGNTIQKAETSSGANTIRKEDWALVTSDAVAKFPAITHVFASPGAKIRPTIRWAGKEIRYTFTVMIPPKAAVGICLFEMPRKNFDTAKKTLSAFDVDKELEKILPKTRRLLLNLAENPLILSGVGIIRPEENDTLTLHDGTEYAGTLTNATFRVKTPFGERTIPAKNVLAALLPTRNDPRIILALKDSQVVKGALMEKTVTIIPKSDKTPASPIAVPLWKVQSFAYRISPEKPEATTPDKPTVTLQKGGQLAFEPKGLDLTFLTEYGRLKLQPEQLAAITLNVPGRVSHRVTFRNGSKLSGLLLATKFTLPLASGKMLKVSRRKINGFRFSPDPKSLDDQEQIVTLRNGDVLRGKLQGKSLTIQTPNGLVTLADKDLASLVRKAFGTSTLRFHKGSTTGSLVEKTLPFQITTGPTISLYGGHVKTIAFPKPKAKPQPKPKPQPKAKPTTPPASAKVKALKAQIQARKTAIDALTGNIADLTRKMAELPARAVARRRLEVDLKKMSAQLADQQAQLKNLQAILGLTQAGEAMKRLSNERSTHYPRIN